MTGWGGFQNSPLKKEEFPGLLSEVKVTPKFNPGAKKYYNKLRGPQSKLWKELSHDEKKSYEKEYMKGKKRQEKVK